MVTHAVHDRGTAPRTGGHSIVMGDRGVPQPNPDQITRQLFSQTEMGFATYPGTYPGTYPETLPGGRRPYLTLLVDLEAATQAIFVVGDVEEVEAGEMIVGIAEETGTSTSEIGGTRHIEMNAVENVIVGIGETEIETASEAVVRPPGVDHLLDGISEIQEI